MEVRVGARGLMFGRPHARAGQLATVINSNLLTRCRHDGASSCLKGLKRVCVHYISLESRLRPRQLSFVNIRTSVHLPRQGCDQLVRYILTGPACERGSSRGEQMHVPLCLGTINLLVNGRPVLPYKMAIQDFAVQSICDFATALERGKAAPRYPDCE